MPYKSLSKLHRQMADDLPAKVIPVKRKINTQQCFKMVAQAMIYVGSGFFLSSVFFVLNHK